MEKHECESHERSWQRYREGHRDHSGTHPGVGFIPMGPWANSIIDPNTYSTGMPTFKGTPVKVDVAMNEPILLGIELVQKLCGVK